jgi:hypothetical protein
MDKISKKRYARKKRKAVKERKAAEERKAADEKWDNFMLYVPSCIYGTSMEILKISPVFYPIVQDKPCNEQWRVKIESNYQFTLEESSNLIVSLSDDVDLYLIVSNCLLINKIVPEKTTKIFKEICKILKQTDGYKFNNKLVKLKKHFPVFYKKDDKVYEHEYKKASFSLLNENINKHLRIFLSTATRRYNGITYLPSTQNWLQKYENYDSMKKKFFPSFFHKDGTQMFKCIYSVKNEQITNFVSINSEQKHFCDTILICVNHKNIFNIFFSLDKDNKYYGRNINYNANDDIIYNKFPSFFDIKSIYEDHHVCHTSEGDKHETKDVDVDDSDEGKPILHII